MLARVQDCVHRKGEEPYWGSNPSTGLGLHLGTQGGFHYDAGLLLQLPAGSRTRSDGINPRVDGINIGLLPLFRRSCLGDDTGGED